MIDKFEKRTSCEYCGGVMEATNRNKRFCSDKCRVYFNREKETIVEPKKEVPVPELPQTPKPEKETKEEYSSFNDYRKKKLGIK